MSARLVLPLAMLAFGCSGSDDVAPIPAPTCSGLETTLLANVPVDSWPVGTIDATDRLQNMAGRYQALDSCKGGPTFVKISATPGSRESIPLVTSPYDDGPCGCTEDTAYDADSEYPLVGVYEGASMFIEDGVEAGAQGSTVFIDSTLFGEGAPLSIRGCGSLKIEPYRGSTYDDIAVVFRYLSSGALSGTYTLTNAEETAVCELTDWVLIAVE